MVCRTHTIRCFTSAMILLLLPTIVWAAGGTLERVTPEAAPAVSWRDGDVQTVRLQDFAGKVVLLNFWATWCTPCVQEMPDLIKLQNNYADKGFKLVAISQDAKGVAAVKPFYKKYGFSLPVYVDDKQKAFRAFKGRGLPTSVLIDRRGRVVARAEGLVLWDKVEPTAMIEFLLEE